jgi:PAS domain S-box-containing protein
MLIESNLLPSSKNSLKRSGNKMDKLPVDNPNPLLNVDCQALLDENRALKDENQALQDEVQKLRERLEEPEELQRAISEGDVDALVMPVSPEDLSVFTLADADSAYRILIETANEDIVILDAEFKITHVGKRLINKTGYSQEEVIGRPWLHFIDESSKVVAKDGMEQVCKGSNESYELKLVCKDGSPYWVLISAKPLFDNAGKFKGILGMLTDITEHKQAEITLYEAYENIRIQSEELHVQSEELQVQNEEIRMQSEKLHRAYEALVESEKRYRTLFDKSMDGIILTDPRGVGIILSANPAACKMLGWTEEELIFKGLDVIFDVKNPATSTLLDEHIPSGSAKSQINCRRKNGTKFTGEISSTFFIDRKGEHRAVAIIRDITERKQMEETLRESSEKIEVALANMSDAVFISDAQGNFVNYNDAFVTYHRFKNRADCSKNFSYCSTLLDVWFTNTGEPALPEMWAVPRALRGETANNVEYTLHRRDTGETWIGSYNFAPLCDKDGMIVGSVVVARDITERKQAEEALQKSEEQYRTLFNTMNEGFCIIEMLFDEHEKPIDYVFVEVNPAFEGQTGLINAVGKRMLELAPDHEKYWFEIYGKVALTGESIRFENRAEALGRWYEVYAYRVGQPEDRKVAIFFNDIKERKQAEKKLEITLQRFYTILSNIHGAILLVSEEGYVEFANDTFCQYFNLSEKPADLVGITSSEMLRKIKDSYSDPDRAMARIKENIERWKPVIGEEVRFIGERTFIRDFIPLSVGGKRSGRLWDHIDITERKKAEDALHDSEQRLQAILDGSDNAFYVKDLEGRFILINKHLEELLGIMRDEVYGKTDYDFFTREMADSYRVNDSRILANGVPEQLEEISDLVDGHHIFLANKFLLYDLHGKPYAICGISADITERKRLDESLHEAYENLQAQSEELQSQSEELQMQNEELQSQSNELNEAYGTLHESEEHYRMLFTNMTEAFYFVEIIYNKNGKPYDYRFLEVNPAYELNMGIKKEQMLGKSLLEVYPNVSSITIDKYNEIAISGQSAHFEIFSQVVKDKYLDVYAFSPEKGKLAVIFRDITERKQIEEALRESESRFHSVLDGSNDVIYRVNMQSNSYEYISPSVEALIGFTQDEATSIDAETGLSMIHPDDLLAMRAAIEHLKETGKSNAEYRQRTKNGDYIWISNHMSLTKDSAGQPLYRNGNIRDITERKWIDEALKESEEKYRNIVETANEGIFVFDSDIRVTYANNKMGEMLGYSPEEMIGRHGTDFVDEEYKIYTEIRKEKRLQGIDEVHENKLVHRNGSIKWALVGSKSIFDKAGKFTGILSMVTDITERKQLEEQTRLRAEELATVMETTPVAIWVGHDPQSHSITGNRMANEFYEVEEGENVSANVTPVRRFFHKGIELNADELPMQEAALNDIDIRNVELDVLLQSGKWRFMLGSASPLHDADGNVRGSVGAFIDITERKQAEDALCESEGKYRNIVETANEGICVTDAEARITYANEKMAKMLDYSREELIGRSTWSFVDKNNMAIAKLNNEKRRQGIEETHEIKLISKDGSPLWMLVSSKSIFDESGNLSSSLNMLTDITERKRAEELLSEAYEVLQAQSEELQVQNEELKAQSEELHEAYETLFRSEEKYRNIVETANEGIAIIDAETRITYINNKMAEMLGYSPEEMIGRSGMDFVNENDQAIAKLNQEKRWQGIEDTHEFKYTRKDGSPLWVLVSSKSLFDGNGKFTSVLNMFTDMTERKKVEEALQKAHDSLEVKVKERTAELEKANKSLEVSEEKYRSLFDNMIEGFILNEVILGFDGNLKDLRYVEINKSFENIMGLTKEVVLGNTIKNLFPQVDPIYMESVAKTVSTGQPQIIEWYSRVLDKYLDTRIYIPKIGYVGVIYRDITERRKAEETLKSKLEELARSNDELEQFAYVSSHDLQEPLRMISSYLQLLQRRYQGKIDEKADKYIYYAVDGAARMQTLINDLLEFSRVTTRAGELEPTDSELVLNQVQSNLDLYIKENKATVSHDPLPEVIADSTQMAQVFQNLIANGIKFHGEEAPRIHISAEKKASEWQFSVKDNGIGIDPQYSERIFEVFKRLHNKEEYPGTGIGLAVCKKIVERNGGHIWVESEHGKGSTFYFTLPINPKEVAKGNI